MSLDRQLAELAELYLEGDLTPVQIGELLGLLRTRPKARGIFRDLLATDYHLREAYHATAYRESLKEGVADQLKAMAVPDDLVASTLARIRELGERWGAEEAQNRGLFGAFIRFASTPVSALSAIFRSRLP